MANEAAMPGKLSGLQALRAAAALLVVADHSVATLIERAGLGSEYASFAWSAGNLGVSIFFAISGFIVTHITWELHEQRGAPLDFMVRRLWRIVPLYWLTTGIYAVKLATEGNPPSFWDMTRSLLFIPYLNGSDQFRPVYGLGWSLNFEMYFYVLVGLGLLASRKVANAGIVFGLTLLVSCGAFAGWRDANANSFTGVALRFVSDDTILYFVAGVCVRLLPWRIPTAGASVVVRSVLVFVTIALCWILGTVLGRIHPALIVPVAAILWLCVQGEYKGESRAVSAVVLLGDASYCIYLTHSFVVGPAGRVWSGVDSSWWPLFLGIMLLLSSALGVFTHLFVERPLLKSLRFLLPKKVGAQAS